MRAQHVLCYYIIQVPWLYNKKGAKRRFSSRGMHKVFVPYLSMAKVLLKHICHMTNQHLARQVAFHCQLKYKIFIFYLIFCTFLAFPIFSATVFKKSYIKDMLWFYITDFFCIFVSLYSFFFFFFSLYGFSYS